MPAIIKTLPIGEYTVTFWSNKNLTIKTQIAIDATAINTYLNKLGLSSLNITQEFAEKASQNLRKKLPRSFIFLTEGDPEKFDEFMTDKIAVQVSKDELTGRLAICPGTTFEEVTTFLRSQNILFGIDNEAIMQNLSAGNSDYFIFAKGKPAVEAKAERYKYHYNPHRHIPIQIKRKGKVMYLDSTAENRVFAETELATITDAVKGALGMTITGHIIPVTKKIPGEVSLGQNVSRVGNEVQSTIDGMVLFDKKLISVVPTHVQRKVMRQETLKFTGNIILENDVMSSKISATGDVIVLGTVENSIISCGGFFYSLAGILGQASQITAKFDIFSAYVNKANLTSKFGNIFIGSEAAHAKLNARGGIVVERKIIGGETISSKSIKVSEAGSDKSNVPTPLSLVSDDSQAEELEDYEEKLSNLNKKLNLIQQQKRQIEALSDDFSGPTGEMYRNLCNVENIFSGDAMHLNNHIASIKADMDDSKDKYILVYDSVWKGTTIFIEELEHIINDKSYASKFYKGDYGIVRKRYD